jgi:hypothetical protein
LAVVYFEDCRISAEPKGNSFIKVIENKNAVKRDKIQVQKAYNKTLLYAVIITALFAIIKQYTWWGGLDSTHMAPGFDPDLHQYGIQREIK